MKKADLSSGMKNQVDWIAQNKSTCHLRDAPDADIENRFSCVDLWSELIHVLSFTECSRPHCCCLLTPPPPPPLTYMHVSNVHTVLYMRGCVCADRQIGTSDIKPTIGWYCICSSYRHFLRYTVVLPFWCRPLKLDRPLLGKLKK